MSEEIQDANINVPRSIFASMILNGCMGFAILLATLFGIGDITSALNSPTKYPFIFIFAQATGSAGGGTAMAIIIVVMIFAATIGFTATSSRMIWAFARDRGLPFSPFLSKVAMTNPLSAWKCEVYQLMSNLTGAPENIYPNKRSGGNNSRRLSLCINQPRFISHLEQHILALDRWVLLDLFRGLGLPSVAPIEGRH